jgi:hypothetical protein
MRFIRTEGLWTCGPDVSAGPTAAVLEVSGAVLAWTVDDPSAPATITLTDVAEAEWLWRVLGEDGHVALLTALADAGGSDTVDLPVETAAEPLQSLRRLAFGHWLRRWWPASARDGIVALDATVVDAEIAVLTVDAQDFFADDTFDSDVADLLRPHLTSLAALAHDGDPRAGELASACLDLADDVGAADGRVVEAPTGSRRDDYALAAGAAGGSRAAEPIASGVDSVDWTAVPPGLFDAADRTVDWAIEVAGAAPVATVRVATSGAVAGIEVRVRAGDYGAAGELTSDGRATLPIVGTAQPMTEDQAWGHDWSATTVTVGADVPAGDDASAIRDRVRAFARARLADPGPDAFLAEVLAAESDY